MSSVLRRAVELLYEREKGNFVNRGACFFVQIHKSSGEDGPVVYQADFSYSPARTLDPDFWLPDYLINFNDLLEEFEAGYYHPKIYFYEDGYASWEEDGEITIYKEEEQWRRVSQNFYKGLYKRL